MQLTLEDIDLYSKCPKQYSFNKQNSLLIKPKKESEEVIKLIIKQAYINRTQHGYDPEWQTIKSRINKYYFENVDISQKVLFEPIYKKSIAMMGALHYWYHNIFQNDDRTGIVNVPLDIDIANSTINTSVDIILLDKKYNAVPVLFVDNTIKLLQLARDLKFKTMLYCLWREIKIIPQMVELAIITQDSVKYQKIFNKTPMDTIEKYVTFIVKGIEHEMFYPSVNEQCNNCIYKNICVL